MKGLTKNTSRGNIYYINKVYKGERLACSTGCTNKREAEVVAKKMISEFEKRVDEELKKKEVPRISTLIDDMYKLKWKSAETGAQSVRLAKMAIEFKDDIPITEVDDNFVAEYAVWLSDDEVNPRSPSTINRYLTALRTLTSFAHKRRLLPYTPNYPIAKEHNNTRIFTRAEMEAILEQAEKCKAKAGGEHAVNIILFLVESGVRLSDCLDLNWNQVDFDRNTVYIPSSKYCNARTLPMTHTMTNILMSMKPEDGKLIGRIWPDNVNLYSVETVFKIIKKKLGVKDDPEFRLHALRHTCASRLASQGVSLQEIGSWLGHKTLSTTMRYAHLLDGHLKPVAAALNAGNKQVVTSAKTSAKQGKISRTLL